MSWFKRIFFLLIVSSFSYFLHEYVVSRLFNLTSLPIATQVAYCPYIVIIGVLLLNFYFVAGTILSVQRWRWLAWMSSIWMGMVFIFALGFAVYDLMHSLIITDINGEQLMVGISLILMIYGVWQCNRFPLIRYVDLPTKKMDLSLHGLKILQLSDIHIGPVLDRKFMQSLVRVSKQLQPDLIVVTGDLVDGTVELLHKEVDPIFDLQCPLGVYFVTGNHEWISGAPAWIEYLKQGGIHVLQNEHITLQYRDVSFNLIGVEDWDAQRFDPNYQADLPKAIEGLDYSLVSILLAHQPKAAPQADELKIDIQLSGHTHGGQIFPFQFLVTLDQKYNRGLFQLKHLLLYVSEGTGYWGPPLRIASRAEITLLTLTEAS